VTATPTWSQATAEVAHERAEIEDWMAQLAALRGSAVFTELDNAALAGRTASRWAQVERAAETAESRLDALRRVVADIGRILAVPDRGDADLARIRRLLHGAAVPLPPSDLPAPLGPPAGSTSSEPQLTIANVNRLITQDLRIIRGLIGEIAPIWALIRPRLDRALTRCAQLARTGRQDGDAAARTRIMEVAASLEKLGVDVVTDPLGAGADKLTARLADLERAVSSERVAQCELMLAALRNEESYARQLAVSRGSTAMPDRAKGLRVRLSSPAEPAQGADFDELEKIALDIDRARAAARELIGPAKRTAADVVECARPDCSGGVIDQATGVCGACFRAPYGDRRAHARTPRTTGTQRTGEAETA
jgi:hypothetical protein